MTKYAAKGTLLKRGNGASPEVFTTVPGIFSGPDGPSQEVEALDVTDHGSGGKREFIAGLVDNGEVSGELHFDPADASHDSLTGLQKDLQDGTLRNFKIVYPDTSECAFAALVTGFEIAASVESKLTAAITLKVSGAITWS